MRPVLSPSGSSLRGRAGRAGRARLGRRVMLRRRLPPSVMLRRRLSRRLSTAGLPEVASAARFAARFEAALKTVPSAADLATLQQQPDNVRLVLRAALSTTHLHTQSRIAAYEGDGFYTIGPCGEELLAAVGLVLRGDDSVAL